MSAMSFFRRLLGGKHNGVERPTQDLLSLCDALLSERVGGDTAERWAARLQALLGSPEKLESLRPRVAAFAREHWSWERCVATYAELLRTCAGPK